MKIIKLALIAQLICVNFISADESVFIAKWSKEEYSGNKKEPYNTFEINLKIDDKYKAVGDFIYVTRWGAKIDGPNDITGILDKRNLVFTFDSSFEGQNAKAQITINDDCSLKWRLLQNADGEFYAPKSMLLPVEKIIKNSLFNCSPSNMSTSMMSKTLEVKSYLYKDLSESSKSKMYLIAGDKVKLLDTKTDDTGQEWYYISYQGKKEIKMWIKAEAVK